MPHFHIRDGRIHAEKLEFNLVDHCNYGCAECSHFSPYLRPRAADLDVFVHDLTALATVYRVRRFRFVGGEPLLHKGVLDFVGAVRASGIAEAIQICTNGSLLHRVPEDLFEAIDMLSVSWYPDSRCDQEKIRRAESLCRAHGTALKVRRISTFRRMQVDQPIGDPDLVDQVFDACRIAHSWSCQTFSDGRFYLCSRPMFTDTYLGVRGEETGGLEEADGVPLHAPSLLPRLVAYLDRGTPLASCSYCLGTVGRTMPWRQTTAAERREIGQMSDPATEIDRRQLALQRRTARLEGRLKAFGADMLGRASRHP